MLKRTRTGRVAVGMMLAGLLLGACSSSGSSDTSSVSADTTSAAATETTAAAAAAETTAAAATDTTLAAAADTTATAAAAPSTPGAGIKLAVNPWTGSAVNANIAKVVLDKMGTPVELVDIDENATWAGLDAGDLDAVLEVWPSGHAKDYDTYITGKKSVIELGKLGPQARIGWYVPQFVLDENPSLATWEGFKDAALAKKFATAESGDLGQFLMGDPSYVSYDEQIIKNLNLPLKFVVAGSEAALITAINQAVADKKPLLLQFWQPHWLQSKVKLARVALPDPTAACAASAAAKDGKYACDYPIDNLYKAASAKLQAKNAMAFTFLQKFQLTTDQQNEIAAMVDSDKMTPADAAKKWVDANPDVVKGWM
jgi:glycine betaine/proline transport system substrate-binding protein